MLANVICQSMGRKLWHIMITGDCEGRAVKRKKMYILVVCALISLCMVGNKMTNYYYSTTSIELLGKQIIKKLNNNIKKYGNLYSQAELSEHNTKELAIYLYQSIAKSEEPIEIYSIFESYLILKELDKLENIDSIYCSLTDTVVIESGFWIRATITKEEFYELYNNLSLSQQQSDEVAMELSSMWMDNNYYYRYALELEEENKYYEDLMTKWNRYCHNSNERYDVSYDYGWIGRFDILDLSIQVYDGSIRTIGRVPINEEGDFYGAWDLDDNIWVYGETTGLQMVFLRDDGSWALTREINVEDAPYALRKVMEDYGHL